MDVEFDWDMIMYTKYPRTMHFPSSPGMTSDDKMIKSLDAFKGNEVVITEKMDGENTTMYTDHIHARSIDSKHHVSRDWVKAFHKTIKHDIPVGFRVCGENVYAKHSIYYENLKTYFYGFSVWSGEICVSWDETVTWFELLGVTPVPVLYRGVFDLRVVQQLESEIDTDIHEGFVCRIADSFHIDEFSKKVAKWVRPNHVQTDKHWSKNFITNGITYV